LTTNDLQVNYEAFDIDSDIITVTSVQWLLSDVVQPEFNNYTALPSENISKNQYWKFKLRASDGEDWSDYSFSSTINILNSAPIIMNVTVTGGETTSDSLSLAFDFYDADNDSLAYPQGTIVWRYLGVTSGHEDDTNIIDSSLTVGGQRWWVEINPDDGDFGGIGTTFNSLDYGLIVITNLMAQSTKVIVLAQT
ncbi:MAG: hypothetical protein ACXADY_23010, partial [Candidatus Hodarchaeales archaeon]